MELSLGFQDVVLTAFLNWIYTTFPKTMVEAMTSGLPHVSELWFWISDGMLHVKHLAPKIPMALNYCGHQLARRLGWVTPAYHKKQGAITHPGECKLSPQYDGRPDGRLRVGT